MTDKTTMIDKTTETQTRRRTVLRTAGVLATTPLLGRIAGVARAEPDTITHPRIVGYYPSWAGDYTPSDIPYDKLTHLQYAFLEPQSDGTVVVGGAAKADLLSELQAYDNENTVFVLSISSGWYSGTFSDAASTPERRQRFAKTAIDIMEKYNFDGLDLDWEFPDGTVRAEDPHNFTLLLEECRKQLDSRIGSWTSLSIAGSQNYNTIDQAYEVDIISDYLDYVNVMTYDFNGGWSNDTNFNAPLYAASDDSDGNTTFNANYAMEHWAGKSIATDKLVVGMPFYGRSFSGVAPANDGLYNSFDSETAETYQTIEETIKPQSDYEYHWHPEAAVPWLYSSADQTFISYDDADSIANKAEYARESDFGGAMCWELSQDPSNTLIDEIHTVFDS